MVSLRGVRNRIKSHELIDSTAVRRTWSYLDTCPTLRNLELRFGKDRANVDNLFSWDLFWIGFVKAVEQCKHLRFVAVNGLKCPTHVKLEIAEALQAHQLDHLNYFCINDWSQ